ncbi:Hsp70 family protein [Tumidithrix elongata RA019]|uniref:Hsp70 family protein n=1 Tax=Tumidithrix elongata BACA0141 TaxID=2716417 RepID=A0AAW9PTC3_9CYAN|nr:Hsp70 family protein [Tumidithrix elongata RA019]
MHYAIDFGTSNTVIARIGDFSEDGSKRSAVETVKLAGLSSLVFGNPSLIPSLVYVQDAQTSQVLVGQEVRDRGLDIKLTKGEPRFFRSFKRAIGNPAPVFVPELDGREVTFEQVGEWFLLRAIAQLPDVESIVFTVPVDSFEPYRQWLGGICERLEVKQVRLLDEPTAAALGYGITRGDETLLVIDFGGGTLDLSLVRLTLPQLLSQSAENSPASKQKSPLGFLLKWGSSPVNALANTQSKAQTAKVLAKVGQTLGGMDIDNWLVDYFHATQAVVKNSLVTRLAEKIKIELSSSEQANEVLFDDETFNSYELQLDRAQFNQILEQHQFFANLDAALEQIRQQAMRQNLELENIDAVLLVGGTAQIPAVRDWTLKHFPAEKVKADKPFEAIAHGAISQGWEVQDFLYHSYGVRYWDKRYKRHNWHTIVKAGQSYPLPKPVELILGASMPDQPSIELVIGELGETNIEVYFDSDRLVTRTLDKNQVSVQPLNDRPESRTIALLNPLGKPGSDRIKVLFTVDSQRTLRITVEDLLTNELLTESQAVVQLI